MDGLQDNDKTTLPAVESQASPYDIPQNNYVLPRNLFTSGTIPGNTILNIGVNNLQIDGKNKKFSVYDGSSNEVVRIGLLSDGTWGITVTGGTITGGTIQTASSGKRVVIDSSNQIKFYSSDGVLCGTVFGDYNAMIGHLLSLDATLVYISGSTSMLGDLVVNSSVKALKYNLGNGRTGTTANAIFTDAFGATRQIIVEGGIVTDILTL
jgi:hypothetical protein